MKTNSQKQQGMHAVNAGASLPKCEALATSLACACRVILAFVPVLVVLFSISGAQLAYAKDSEDGKKQEQNHENGKKDITKDKHETPKKKNSDDKHRPRIPAQPFPVLAPATVVRETGAPVTQSFDFAIKNTRAKYVVRLEIGKTDLPGDGKGDNGRGDKRKGDGDRNEHGASVRVALNGKKILHEEHFNNKKKIMEEDVHLKENNTLDIQLAGKPGVYVIVQIIGYDRDLPTIKAIVDPVPNAAGWNNTDVIVRFDCQDKTSPIKFCTAPVAVSLEGKDQIITGVAIDQSGHSANTSGTE